jgi:hypothetical protein
MDIGRRSQPAQLTLIRERAAIVVAATAEAECFGVAIQWHLDRRLASVGEPVEAPSPMSQMTRDSWPSQ